MRLNKSNYLPRYPMAFATADQIKVNSKVSKWKLAKEKFLG
jgi:hypothetical protein